MVSLHFARADLCYWHNRHGSRIICWHQSLLSEAIAHNKLVWSAFMAVATIAAMTEQKFCCRTLASKVGQAVEKHFGADSLTFAIQVGSPAMIACMQVAKSSHLPDIHMHLKQAQCTKSFQQKSSCHCRHPLVLLPQSLTMPKMERDCSVMCFGTY